MTTTSTADRLLTAAIWATKHVGLAASFVAIKSYRATIALFNVRAELRGNPREAELDA